MEEYGFAAPVAEDCVECASHAPECQEDACASAAMTAQCTDQCVVLACNDATHDAMSCHTAQHCAATCEVAADCQDCDGFEEFLQCCTDYHAYFSDARPHPAVASTIDWNPPSSSSLSGALDAAPLVGTTFAPDVPRCMWGDCSATFYSLCDLVGHVNVHHLRTSPAAPAPAALACHWGDCAVYPASQSFPGPSAGTTVDAARTVLADHLLRDHFGMQVEPASHSPMAMDTSPISPISPTAAASGAHECAGSGSHACGWQGCSDAFDTCEQLTEHITGAHVGAGKSRYECFWAGCTRHGAQGFASKQKICRHIQSHTGHRPFQCRECKQNFSEAATLQQHMRRHTQEKPYACDFPGCGKAFAITGALTIHKRTHNGLKPFRCAFCDRAFAESSNLSKHLRTHTGDRPYACGAAGCEKAFARPDQLTRHMSVHRKKAKD
ncbi:hypothetical protein FIBSPDRAFT_748386 [Athelia psychrophila]|uniref:C2H2-type domain-containing protein n=1 Tax=Athelia psychrophila TaxID=1759441 RepID=A0A166FCP4_9AGAM|nr:hypothetical protein FIBSPDRAFT_748386 [Fibularhizoctonia sp. CBS 109695]